MYIMKLLRSCKGYIIFSVDGNFPERIINMISSRNILIWNIEKKNGSINIYTIAKNYKEISKLAKKIGLKTKVIERIGIYFFINRYKKRIGILIGLIMFISILLFMQNFVWTINIYGNKNISSEYIYEKIEEYGLKKGSFIPLLDFKQIQKDLMIDLENISWLSINDRGTNVDIEIRESVEKPDIKDEHPVPKNIIASKNGKILEMNIFEGDKILNVGDYVLEGDLIVSGMYKDKYENEFIVSANGNVIAETLYKKEFSIKLYNEEKKYIKNKSRYILDFFGIKIPLYIATKIEGYYDIEKSFKSLNIFGKTFPITIYKNKYNIFYMEDITLTEEEADIALEKYLEDYEKFDLNQIEILERSISKSIIDNEVFYKIDYICKENIAKEKDIEY
ncbi:MAG: sporulation protein YqfD [Oscillospiraceae bacterium]|nr:sporulation protein YqfD [Oscillospiraceae bacterium]